jgi:hypothetical protein
MKVSFIIILLISFNLFASEFETDSYLTIKNKVIEKVKKYGPKKTLLVLDIDNTTLQMSQNFGSDQWWNWQSGNCLGKEKVPSFCVTNNFSELLDIQGQIFALSNIITFYHDMNGLLAVHRLGIPITIVLLNNDGGGIFHRLPISQHDPDFTDYFVTPHGLDFSHAAKLYGLEYVQVTERDDFREAFANSINQRSSMIIEVRTDAKHDLQRRNEIVQAVHAKLATLDL